MNKPNRVDTRRDWISIADELPKHNQTVEYASHQMYGIASFHEKKGFHKAFLTSGPWEEGEYQENVYCLNDEIMWWRPITDWPYYGRQGCDSETMKDFPKG